VHRSAPWDGIRQVESGRMAPQAPATPGRTESVGKAIRLLNLFRSAQNPVRIAEASAATGLARSTTHRLLATLAAQDFVRQDPATRAYYPGPALLTLARSLSRELELREIARAEMQAMVKRTGETANLIVLQDGKALFVEGLEGPHVLRVGARVVWAGAPHATAGGKAILAEMTDAQIARLHPGEKLPRLTSHTIPSQRKLLRALADVRAAGFATSSGESNLGVYAVACAIKSASGTVYGALSLAAPLARATAPVTQTLASEVRRAAGRIAGYFP
jgi:IclR family acetate operon transcriptional repressor